MKNLALLLGVIVIFALAGVLGLGIWHTAFNHTATAANGQTSATSNANLTVDSIALDKIPAILSNNSDLDMSVSITDLQTGKSYHYGDAASYDVASVAKLMTATAFLHMVEQGQFSLNDDIGDDTAQNQLKKMIVDSDNDAWAAMENAIGLDAQKSYADSIGLSSYEVEDNVISSSDIASLLTKLCSGKLLDDSHQQLLLDYMQQANYRDYIVAAIPKGVTVYHKVGILDDRLHDAAVIKKGGRSYVLVIFSKSDTGSYDFDRGSQLFASITKDSLAAFFGSI